MPSKNTSLTPEQKEKTRLCIKRSAWIAFVFVSLCWIIWSDVGNAILVSIFGGLLVFFMAYYSQLLYFKLPLPVHEGVDEWEQSRPYDPDDPRSAAYRPSHSNRDYWYDYRR